MLYFEIERMLETMKPEDAIVLMMKDIPVMRYNNHCDFEVYDFLRLPYQLKGKRFFKIIRRMR